MALSVQVTFDAADPRSLAEFWALALGYEVQSPPEGFASWDAFCEHIGLPRELWDSRSAVIDPSGQGPRLFFQRVPEPKSAKNRVHLDVNASRHTGGEHGWRLVLEKADALVAAGATVVREVDEPLGRCLVMRDPEGNEFCVQ
ncbi:VOC family protein [Saccharomonospora piscinae]|uniref:VOC family protein n=1 Tax=Saccharomonospora piscinae TaxID=687388 RepID=UPI0011075885|nr:VOC family protein [Saccharomonospora piscinae]TLW92359.1 VOC family protein [Saccharomonospora piscinae]